MLAGGRIVVTGGSGFLAQALVPRILAQNPKSVLCIARNEGQLIKMRERFGVDIRAGDIAEPWIAKQAVKDATAIFHLGAFKHVGMAETQAHQCVHSNVMGTMTLLGEAIRWSPDLFMFISTDKAAQVKGVYGATKLIGERLVQEAALMHTTTKYRIVRYGNILYSTGSVLPIWRQAIEEGRPVSISDPNMTRFYWTVDQAVDLIFECMDKAESAQPYVPQMKSVILGNLLEAVMRKYGRVEVIQTGKGAADNMHETVDGKVFSDQVEHFTIDELMHMV